MKFLLISLVTLFLFNGCADKSSVKPIEKTVTSTEVNSDEFDDFEDEEFEVEEKSDPFSGYNRSMTTFNDKFYIYVFNPVSRGYRWAIPKEGRKSIGKFFHNLFYPIRLVNNVLQGKMKNSAEETGRFVINTTIGILGFFAPAKSYFGLEPHNEDFGQTLGFYGVGGGYHIVLPFLGPSNMRDMFSLYPDSFASPNYYQANRPYNFAMSIEQTYMSVVLEKVNYGSLHIGEYEDLKKDSIDLYPFLRDIYEQYREKLIKE
jgi:phospholipid-binding lipoprotein MlaA